MKASKRLNFWLLVWRNWRISVESVETASWCWVACWARLCNACIRSVILLFVVSFNLNLIPPFMACRVASAICSPTPMNFASSSIASSCKVIAFRTSVNYRKNETVLNRAGKALSLSLVFSFFFFLILAFDWPALMLNFEMERRHAVFSFRKCTISLPTVNRNSKKGAGLFQTGMKFWKSKFGIGYHVFF